MSIINVYFANVEADGVMGPVPQGILSLENPAGSGKVARVRYWSIAGRLVAGVFSTVTPLYRLSRSGMPTAGTIPTHIERADPAAPDPKCIVRLLPVVADQPTGFMMGSPGSLFPVFTTAHDDEMIVVPEGDAILAWVNGQNSTDWKHDCCLRWAE